MNSSLYLKEKMLRAVAILEYLIEKTQVFWNPHTFIQIAFFLIQWFWITYDGNHSQSVFL